MNDELVHRIPLSFRSDGAPGRGPLLRFLPLLIHGIAAVALVWLHLTFFWNMDLSAWWPPVLGMLATAGCVFALVFMEQIEGRAVGAGYVLGFNLALVLAHAALSVHWAMRPPGSSPNDPTWLVAMDDVLHSAWLYWGLYPAALLLNWFIVRSRPAG